jgi:Icc-related predicted phosphoesterase
MKVTCISDTHQFLKNSEEREKLTALLSGGDCLVHAGDISGRGTVQEVQSFLDWFSSLNYTYKIFIAGNHDYLFEKESALAKSMVSEYPGLVYLNDSGTEVEGIKFWGSPITPHFHNWAFNRFPDRILQHWEMIPDDTDFLITHGPPRGILDELEDSSRVGCPALLSKVLSVKPKVHVFGHIHCARGIDRIDRTIYINAAVLDESYRLVEAAPFEIEIF